MPAPVTLLQPSQQPWQQQQLVPASHLQSGSRQQAAKLPHQQLLLPLQQQQQQQQQQQPELVVEPHPQQLLQQQRAFPLHPHPLPLQQPMVAPHPPQPSPVQHFLVSQSQVTRLPKAAVSQLLQQPASLVVSKQDAMQDLSAQLRSLRLKEKQLQQAMQRLCWQQPCLSTQECSRLSKQLNTNSRDLKILLFAVCTGWCGSSSNQLFPDITALAQQHNEDVLQAAAAGVQKTERYEVDVLGMKERGFGRTLLHLLVSEFPATVVMPDGSMQLHGPTELVQYIERTAIAAVAAAAAAATLGTDTSNHQYRDALTSAAAASSAVDEAVQGTASRLARTLQAAAAAATATTAAPAASHAASSSSSLLPDVRTELLQQLRQLAVQQGTPPAGRWPEVLTALSNSGSSAWLTACHWALPEALDFFIEDTTFNLQDMMLMTKSGGEHHTLGLNWACSTDVFSVHCF
jgi:hypothetical protein